MEVAKSEQPVTLGLKPVGSFKHGVVALYLSQMLAVI